MKIAKKSWIDSRLEIRDSLLSGKGIFTTEMIFKDELVIVWGGTLFTSADIAGGKSRAASLAQIDEDSFLGDPADTLDDAGIANYLNHSCDPNLWMKDAVTLQARRDIQAGEELTVDYATQDGRPGLVIISDCRCGSPACRHQITGDDWRLPGLQKSYHGHFSPYLNKRIGSILLT